MRTPLFRNVVRLLCEAQKRNLEEKGIPFFQAGMTRRGFVKGVAGVAAVAAMPRVVLAAGKPVPEIAVIGAGLAGLNAAYQLKKAGLSATVYEANTRVGGRMMTARSAVGEGLLTEMGGELINTDHNDMHALAEEFGIELFERKPNKESVVPHAQYYVDGRAWPEAELAEALRPLAEVITADSARLDNDYDAVAPELDALSVADYLDRHAGKISHKAVRRLLEDSVRVEYGSEPSEASALQLIFNLPVVEGGNIEVIGSSDEAFVVKGGSDLITSALHEKLAGQVKTSMRLAGITQDGGRYVLSFENGQRASADFIIIAIPFTVLRKVNLSVEIPPELKAFIHEVDLGANDKVIVGFKEKAWQSEQGFSGEAWADEAFHEAWDCTARQPELAHGALTFYMGGDVARTASGKSNEASGKEMVGALGRFIPGLVEQDAGQYMRTSWTKNAYSRGAYSNFRPGQLTRFSGNFWIESEDAEESQQVSAGNLFFAGEHVSDAFFGFMNGAAETGRLAAQALVERLAEVNKK